RRTRRQHPAWRRARPRPGIRQDHGRFRMSQLTVIVVAVLTGDQAIKLLLRRYLGSAVLALGPYGSVRLVARRLWLRRLAGRRSRQAMWWVWSGAAVALVMCSALVPLNTVCVGLLLGASLSHAAESS